jgi:hypothetical protein
MKQKDKQKYMIAAIVAVSALDAVGGSIPFIGTVSNLLGEAIQASIGTYMLLTSK